MAAPISCASDFPARDGARAAAEPGLRRRIECRIPRGEERHRGAAEQRHAGGAGFPGAAARRLSAIPKSSPSPARSSSAIRTSSAKRPGLTQGWWQDGGLRVRHRIDDADRRSLPVLLRRRRIAAPSTARSSSNSAASTACWSPFTWRTPTSATWRGSAAGRCSTSRAAWYSTSIAAPSARSSRQDYIQAVLKKNFLLFCWKNIHEWRRLASHFFFAWAGARAGRDLRRRPAAPEFRRALAGLPAASAGRALAAARAGAGRGQRYAKPSSGRSAATSATASPPWRRAPERLRVLFVSPYPICPPVHGGGVFMYQTLREMAKLAEVHVVELLDWPCAGGGQPGAARPSARPPSGWCGPAATRRGMGSLRAARRREFANRRSGVADPPPDLSASRSTCCSSSTRRWRSIAASSGASRTALFEHDVYFQSIGRGLGHMIGVCQTR